MWTLLSALLPDGGCRFNYEAEKANHTLIHGALVMLAKHYSFDA